MRGRTRFVWVWAADQSVSPRKVGHYLTTSQTKCHLYHMYVLHSPIFYLNYFISSKFFNCWLLHTWKYSPRIHFPPFVLIVSDRANLRQGKSCLLSYLSLNKTLSGWIQNEAKLSASRDSKNIIVRKWPRPVYHNSPSVLTMMWQAY